MDDVMDEQKHLHRTQQRLCQEKNRNERATSNAQNMWARWKSNILVLLSSRRPTLLVERFWLRCVYAAIAVRYTFLLQCHTQHTHIKRGAPRKKKMEWNIIRHKRKNETNESVQWVDELCTQIQYTHKHIASHAKYQNKEMSWNIQHLFFHFGVSFARWWRK